jgi:Dolichyl-phosphate-mannose-protein mannosyltransferase
MAVSLVAGAVGVVKSLPYAPETDEPIFVQAAVRIARSGDLNPHWLGHPGATVIYPLAGAFRVLYGSGLDAHGAAAADLYLIGRWLSIAYEVLSLPLVFLVGRRLFGTTAGLIGSWLVALLPIAVAHAQVVRTDSAGVFFGLLAIWLCLRIAERPGPTRVALAGIAIGVAIATRYFMVALVPVLIGVIFVGVGRRAGSVRAAARLAALGGAAAALGFGLMSPYTLLATAELQKSLIAEARTNKPGADGLSSLGNGIWYLTSALPDDLTWPIAGLTLVGIWLAIRARHAEPLVLLGYVAVHLVLVSLPALHWHRWIIQVLPVLAVYCGYAIQVLAGRAPAPRLAALALVALVSVQPAYQLLAYELQQVTTSPSVRAREWILANVPKGSRLAVEGYGPPLAGTGHADTTMFSIATPGGPEDLAERGYRYAVVSSAVFDRFLSEPERYAWQVAFYAALFARGQLVAEFDSPVPAPALFSLIAGAECNCALHPTRGGVNIRIYALSG